MGMKKDVQSEKAKMTELVFNGLSCEVDDSGRLVILVPQIDVPKFDDYIFNRNLNDWAQRVGISEDAFMRATASAEDKFYASIAEGSMIEYLMDHKE